MKLKNTLIVVSDIEKSKAFYKELFGLFVLADFGENVILSEGLVLQEKKLWEKFIDKKVSIGGNDSEIYFEENNIDQFRKKLDESDFNIEYINKCIEHEWGQRVIRLYDPDMHIIEIGESLEYVARRYLKAGMTVEDTAAKVQLTVDHVRRIAKNI